MAEANLNQEDIFDAIIDRFVADEGSENNETFKAMGFLAYIKLVTSMIELDLHKSAPFEKLMINSS